MIKYDYKPYESLITVDRGLTREEFLRRCGVRSGYAKNLFGIIYDAIFSEAEDLRESFEKYYGEEYDSFLDYLQREFCLPRNVIEEFSKVLSRGGENITVIRWSQLNYGENGMSDFIFSDELYDEFSASLCSCDIES